MKKGAAILGGMTVMLVALTIFVNKSEVALADQDTIRSRLARYCRSYEICALPWLSMPGSAYYDETITVSYNQTSVPVVIRGAGYANATGYYKVRSAGLRPEGGGDVSLYGLSGTTLYRGNLNGGRGMSNQGSEINVTLYVGDKTGWQKTRLYSCLQYTTSNGGGYQGGFSYCDTSDHYVNIRRLPPPWDIRPDTQLKVNGGGFSASDKTASPGDTLTWKHALGNTGPGDMTRDIGIYVDVQENRVNKSYYPGYYNVQWRGNNGAWYNTGHLTQLVKASDAGKLLCQRIAWSPLSSSNGGWGASKEVCANIPYNYRLTPAITLDSTYLIEAATSFSSSGTVINHGPTYAKPVDYSITRFVAPRNTMPTTSLTGVRQTNGGPCAIASHLAAAHGGAQHCQQIVTGNRSFPDSVASLPSANDTTIGDLKLKAGDRLCYMTTVNHYTHDHGPHDYAYAMQCAVVAKTPKVQVWGGDIRTNKDIKTRTTTLQDGKMFGSWAEYGAIANGTTTIASGATLSTNQDGRVQLHRHPLTFANANGATGSFGFTFTDVSSPRFTRATGVLPSTPSLGLLPNGTHTAASGASVSLAGQVPQGKRLVIKAHKVTITDDITYGDGSFSLATIPQLVIEARTIIIKPHVRRIDAWLITPEGGAVSTCSDATGNIPSAGIRVQECNKQLRVNGPVYTDKLYLRRTYGAEAKGDAHLGTPAEIFHLRPDAYITGHATSRASGAIRTMYIRELPPRL